MVGVLAIANTSLSSARSTVYVITLASLFYWIAGNVVGASTSHTTGTADEVEQSLAIDTLLLAVVSLARTVDVTVSNLLSAAAAIHSVVPDCDALQATVTMADLSVVAAIARYTAIGDAIDVRNFAITPSVASISNMHDLVAFANTVLSGLVLVTFASDAVDANTTVDDTFATAVAADIFVEEFVTIFVTSLTSDIGTAFTIARNTLLDDNSVEDAFAFDFLSPGTSSVALFTTLFAFVFVGGWPETATAADFLVNLLVFTASTVIAHDFVKNGGVTITVKMTAAGTFVEFSWYSRATHSYETLILLLLTAIATTTIEGCLVDHESGMIAVFAALGGWATTTSLVTTESSPHTATID